MHTHTQATSQHTHTSTQVRAHIDGGAGLLGLDEREAEGELRRHVAGGGGARQIGNGLARSAAVEQRLTELTLREGET